jgi:mRNA interferase MazF
VVASRGYLAAVPELVIVVPATTRDRNWAHHVRLTGPRLQLPESTWAMTEQPRTISRIRITGRAGSVERERMREIGRWLDDFLHHP